VATAVGVSFDFKLLLVYGVLVLFASRSGPSFEMDLTVAAVLTTGLTVLSTRHRRAGGWRG
jgi:hypothetical protein